MKYLKLFAFALAATLFAACSDDDEFSVNRTEVTAGFSTDTLKIKESAGIYNIPIQIEGKRTGDILLRIKAEGVGEHPAVEGTHFQIVEKNIKLLAENDTTSSTTVNIQFQAFDNTEINEARELKLSIESASGVKLLNESLVVVLRDNDAAFYERFAGKWTLTAKNKDDKEITKTITISAAMDENDPEYDNILWVSAPALFDVGVTLNCEWPMQYTFDKETKTGTLSHLMNKNTVASYGSDYQWVFLTDDGQKLSDAPVTAQWQLDEGDVLPTEIYWGEEKEIYLYRPKDGYSYDLLYDIKISR